MPQDAALIEPPISEMLPSDSEQGAAKEGRGSKPLDWMNPPKDESEPELVGGWQNPKPRITTAEQAAALAPGTTFVGPDGKQRIKPYIVNTKEEADAVPEGMHVQTPDGKIRQKPRYEGLNFTAQTLYDIALTDKEKFKALDREYPGKVKKTADGELYVDDDGKLLKPGRGMMAAPGFITAAAAPTGGAVFGAIGGGAGGTAATPGPGTVGGAVLGGASGAIAGQFFNDLLLQLYGVYDRSHGEEAANLGIAGLTGGMGVGIGRGVSTVIPSIKAGVSSATAAAPGLVSKFLGANKDDIKLARELSEKGVMVPPSSWAHEAPHLQNLVEVFDPAFRTNKPLAESAAAHYEKSAGKILDEFGIKPEGSLLDPKTAVPTQKAGEALMRRTLEESAQADAKLQAVLAERKAALETALPEKMAQREALLEAAEQSRKKAQALIDQGFKDIQRDTDDAFKVAKVGGNTGELWEGVGAKLQALKKGIQARHSEWYKQADQAAGEHLPNSQGLSDVAGDFLKQMPEGFEGRYPGIVQKLRDLAGVVDEHGKFIKEPVQPTFGQLHNLRSDLRNNVNWYEIAPDMKDGVYKFFSKRVDDILHDASAVPELQTAARLLDATDKSYGESMAIFKDRAIRTVIKGLESGEPADPKLLFNAVVKEGRTDLTNKVKDMVGPNLWSGVRAADVQEMLDASKTLVPGQIDARAFAKQVLDRDRSNMLEVVHGKEVSDGLRKQAQYIAALDGKVDIKALPGDTITSIIGRARLEAEAAKKAAQQDPLKVLTQEMRKIEADTARTAAKAKAERRNDPLGFLYEPTTGASEAVNKILSNEDLILAAAAKFGEKSPEFTMLRQIYVQRFLQGSMQPAGKLEKAAPEIQQLMFPGVTLDQMKTLAKEMEFLLDTRAAHSQGAGSSMSAFAKVEHPVAGKFVSRLTQMIPGVNPTARAARGAYYALVTKAMTSPALLRWIEKGLTGTPEQREAVRALTSKVLQKGGAVGGGVAEAEYQNVR